MNILSSAGFVDHAIAPDMPDAIKLTSIPAKILGQYGFVRSVIFLNLFNVLVYPTGCNNKRFVPDA
jgi:hypothetical protein